MLVGLSVCLSVRMSVGKNLRIKVGNDTTVDEAEIKYEIHDKNKTRKRIRTRGRRRKRRGSHRVLDPTYPELLVARATLVHL